MTHLIDKSAVMTEIEYLLKKTPTYNVSQAIIKLENK